MTRLRCSKATDNSNVGINNSPDIYCNATSAHRCVLRHGIVAIVMFTGNRSHYGDGGAVQISTAILLNPSSLHTLPLLLILSLTLSLPLSMSFFYLSLSLSLSLLLLVLPIAPTTADASRLGKKQSRDEPVYGPGASGAAAGGALSIVQVDPRDPTSTKGILWTNLASRRGVPYRIAPNNVFVRCPGHRDSVDLRASLLVLGNSRVGVSKMKYLRQPLPDFAVMRSN